MFSSRRLLVFVVDILLIASAYYLSFLLRFDFSIPVRYSDLFLKGLGIVLLVKPVIFLSSGMYRSLWRYASLQDAIEIVKMVTISSAASAFLLMYLRMFGAFPRSIFILDWFLLFFFMSASRLTWRIYRESFITSWKRTGKKTLVVGAGAAASLLLKEISRLPNSPYHVVGLVDDDPGKQGRLLHGIPVLGSLSMLKELLAVHDVENVVIAMPSAGKKVIRTVVGLCKEAKVQFKTVPSIGDIIDDRISVSQLKSVEIDDLLGREPVVIDETAIKGYLTSKRVLVTGAAGSIGSEICRQLLRFKPAKIILVDCAETPLFYLEKELAAKSPDLPIVPVIGDVRNSGRMEAIFSEFSPEVVFHAAAYKHVPLMEYNPIEAITCNIMGTRTLADIADRHRVRNFVMVSTDKAVNPTNVMGATKRAAEKYVQALSAASFTKFTTVRFGNVLGSNGSVIPLFKEQIKNGGPVTVTDPRMTRYFMTIPEATRLVLQAGCLGSSGEIFVLDMGEPVRIVSLAEQLIRLSGLTPYTDIEISFTGLRPGEKLYEELLIAGEGVKPTVHEKIKVLAPVKIDLKGVRTQMEHMIQAVKDGQLPDAMALLHELVREYAPQKDFGQASVAFQRLRPDLFDIRKRPLVSVSNKLPLQNAG